MALDLKKLEKAVTLADGKLRARCPACAEKGQDKTGEHLRVYPDGRFGCCVFPKDREHRKRIFALAGERGPKTIQVRIAAAKSAGPVQSGILGRLGRLFPTLASVAVPRDARDGVGEVQPRTVNGQPSGTPGTGSTNSKPETARGDCLPAWESGDSGTPGTGLQYSRACTKKVPSEEGENVYTLKGFRGGVPGVPEREGANQPPESAGEGWLPYFNQSGDLMIPLDTPPRYRWWQGGQDIDVTLAEVRSWQEKQQGED
jgi:hypothetical protein